MTDQRVIQAWQITGGLSCQWQQRGFGHAWHNIDINEPGCPVLIKDQISARQIPESKRLVHQYRCLLNLFEERGTEPRWNKILRAPGVVPGVEVVVPLRYNFDWWKRLRPLSYIDDGDGYFCAGNVLLDECPLVVSEAGHHGVAKLIGVMSQRDAEAGTALIRFDDDW